MEVKTIIEGRCADCIMDMLQISGRGPGKYGYCRLRKIVLEYPWAMVCQHYQYWGDRPIKGKPRILLDRTVYPLLDYADQKQIRVFITPEDLKARHLKELDDNIKRNVGACFTAQEFSGATPEKQISLLDGYLSGFNPFNFVIAVNALHNFPIEKFPEDKRNEILCKLVSTDRKADFGSDTGMLADKLVYAAGWSLARTGRDLLAYVDSLHLKKHKSEYEEKLLGAARKFINNQDIKTRPSLLGFLFGR
jgi:hypothetical protein